MSFSSGVRAQSCDPAAASVISVQGDVEVSGHDRAHWRDVQLNQVLCAGQQVRLMAKSRAVLQLPNETLIHLDEGSVFTLRAIEADKPAWLDLLRGALHIISRVPRALNIRTPLVNAGIEGTEFALRVDPAQAELWVYEGRVRFSNTLGQLLIASGEAAAVAPGRAPERRIVVKPRQAVEWALYYPPLLDSRPESYPEALRPAVLAYRRNDFTAAFAALDGVPEGARDARYHILRAGLLLSVGRVPEAEGDLTSAERLDPKNGSAYALRSVIAVVRNEQEEALKLAAEAVRLAPGSATPYVARSYAEQSAFEIQKAQQSIQQASRLAPEDALVWARLAELELSHGDLDAALEAATKAETLDPGLSRTQTVLGFAYLTRIEVDKARAAFDRAIARDPADPLPRLGLGLAKIRDADLDAGTEEIEIAASLDPNNSLVRSYLGKAYYERKRGGLASSEYEQAKLLDPKDPTPWFYDAIEKQTTNRPVEALHDLQKAIDLNDNRAVYRSRLLLDEDLAARSASLGRIYTDLGFQQLALVEGWKSVNTDPSNYSAHRFLADSYSVLPRHEIARVSELLQSQLLQPINTTAIQPRLAESNLFLISAGGPGALSFNEFNPIFNRDGVTLQTSALAGENDTYAGEGVVSGIYKNTSFSVGGLHYTTDGFRENTDQQDDIATAFVQRELSPSTSIQAEYKYRRTKLGDIHQRFFPEDIFPGQRNDQESQSIRLGGRHAFSPGSIVLGSFTYGDADDGLQDEQFPGSRFIDVLGSAHVFGGEIQHLFRSRFFNLTSGVGYSDLDGEIRQTVGLFEPDPPEVSETIPIDLRHINVYGYGYINLLKNAVFTLGASVDSTKGEQPGGGKDQFNPKFGITWEPIPGTTLRAAAFRILKRTLITDQTLEPTQVAGFNQLFDDANLTEAWRYGGAIDQKFTENIFGGVEYSKRDLNVPFLDSTDPENPRTSEAPWDEHLGRAYLFWTPHPWLALRSEYVFERFERDEQLPEGLRELDTHRVPLGINVFHPSGLSASLTTTYWNQDGEFQHPVTGEIRSGRDDFWLVDAAISYRLPKRYGFITAGATNLFDEEFKYFDDSDNPIIKPDRAFFVRITLSFP